jgi:hypothetical protein
VIKGGENVDQIDAEMETAHEKWLFTKKKAYVYSYAATSGRMLKLVGVLCDDSHTEHGVMPGGVVLYLGGSQDEVGEFELSFCA